MRCWWVESPGPIAGSPLESGERADPHPGLGEVRVAVRTCGVCRTDLHLAEGDVPPRASGVVPGHEIVGVVDELGPGTQRFALGDRIGIAWLRRTRSAAARQLALELGASSATSTAPPEPVESAVLFAPAGELVPLALSALDQGGTLAIAGIHLTDIPPLRYADHLFRERSVCSVTANTRRDGEEFLAIAARIGARVQTQAYGFDDADRALRDLATDHVRGAAVLHIS